MRALTGAFAGLALDFYTTKTVFGGTKSRQNNSAFRNNLAIPPLFCVAYVTPDAFGQRGQEPMVAKYPLALVPQDNRLHFKRWRDRVKAINPGIVLLGYQMVIEETMVPGPGHDRLRKAQNSWCVYPGGIIPTVESKPKRMRIFDPRNPEWRDSFLEACRHTLSSYPFDGLFLDQCSVFYKAHPLQGVRQEMKVALQETLLELRREFPKAILVGNSRESWSGLNGEMNEGRPDTLAKEFEFFSGHVLPRVELCQTYLRRDNDVETVKREMSLAHQYGGFYGACVNAQHVLWFDIFDEIIAKYKSA